MSRPLPSSAARERRAWIATLVPAAATTLAVLGGVWLVDPTLVAESRSLALLAALVIVPALFVSAGRPLVERWLAPLLAVVAAWSLPTPARGAVVVTLLVVVLFAALVRIDGTRLEHLVAAAIGIQVLLRSDLLLAPFDAVLVPWLVLPVLAALAVAQLERDGRGRGLLAGAVVISLAGAITPPACAALLAVAAGRWVAEHRRFGRVGLLAGGLGLGALGAAGAAAGWWTASELALLVVVVVGAVIAAALGREAKGRTSPEPPELEAWGRWWGALVLVAAAVLPLLTPPRPWSAVVRELSWLVLLLPLLGLTLGRAAVGLGRDVHGSRVERQLEEEPFGGTVRRALFAAIALAVVALRALPPDRALPTALALAALSLPATLLRASGAVSTMLLAGTVVAGAYPWLRDAPLAAALDAFDLAPGWAAAVAAALVLAAWSGVPRLRRVVVAAGVGLVVVRLWLAGPLETLHRWPPFDLSPKSPEWRLEGLAGASSELRIQTALANSASLVPGREVAEVRLESTRGELRARFALRVGEQTGEWAAAREDLRHVAAPDPWISAVDPSGRFFAQRYRALLPLETPAVGDRLVIRRAAELPAEVVLTVFRVSRRIDAEGARAHGTEVHP